MGPKSSGFTDGMLLFQYTKTFFLHFSEVDVGHFRCVSSRVFLQLCDQKLENAAVLAGSIGQRYSPCWVATVCVEIVLIRCANLIHGVLNWGSIIHCSNHVLPHSKGSLLAASQP